jgi:nucleoside 2-deoxyribosyltransferase
MKKIYIAGPEVFLPNAGEVLEQHKSVCSMYGFIGLSPLDNVIEGVTGLDLAKQIFLSNCKQIDECDIVVANCNSFRGAVIDDGTAFEIGYAKAKNKQVYGYIHKIRPLPQIVLETISTDPHASGFPIDRQGYLVNEIFGNSINLMLEFGIKETGGELVEGSFQDCISKIRK